MLLTAILFTFVEFWELIGGNLTWDGMKWFTQRIYKRFLGKEWEHIYIQAFKQTYKELTRKENHVVELEVERILEYQIPDLERNRSLTFVRSTEFKAHLVEAFKGTDVHLTYGAIEQSQNLEDFVDTFISR